ncbi:MAG: diguanylate cyclase [Burkholderiaceae bacterium]
MTDSLETKTNKDILKATLQFMSTHSADFGPHAYTLWFHFADQNEAVAEALKPFVVGQRRMTVDEQSDLYWRLIAPPADTGLDEVMMRLTQSLEQVERAVDGSLLGAAGLLDELEQFSSSLSEDERALFGNRLDRLKSASHEVQYLLGKSSSLLSDSMNELPEFCIAPEALSVKRAGTVVDFATILSGLHRLCDVQTKTSRASGLLIEIDRIATIAEELNPVATTALIDEVARRIAALLSGDGDVGHYEDQKILVLLASTSLSSAEALAARIVEDFSAAPMVAGAVKRTISVSVGAVAVTEDDIPEGVLGRLNRAVQRVAMRGGCGFETA